MESALDNMLIVHNYATLSNKYDFLTKLFFKPTDTHQ